MFVSLDGKHRIKVGEPCFTVAAVERGRKGFVKEVASTTTSDLNFFSQVNYQ